MGILIVVLVVGILGVLCYRVVSQRPRRSLVVRREPRAPDEEGDQLLGSINREVSYLGGHPDRTEGVTHARFHFFRNGVAAVDRAGDVFFSKRWSELQGLDSDARDRVQRRVTWTRMATLGVFAIAFPKDESAAYLVATDATGEWIFEVPNTSTIELRAQLQTYSKVEPRPPSRPSGTTDPVGRLRRLQEAREQELISDEEFRELRKPIVDEM